MKRHRHAPEQIVRKLREGDPMLNDGKDITEVSALYHLVRIALTPTSLSTTRSRLAVGMPSVASTTFAEAFEGWVFGSPHPDSVYGRTSLRHSSLQRVCSAFAGALAAPKAGFRSQQGCP